ncbi:unnamed protein product [Durusdinium trenchii]|uniref:Uncharacterized protein n=1 Tax=Durusdinium trenchii TaxID=1381693 RepID=A0ABP0JYB5_9DINO
MARAEMALNQDKNRLQLRRRSGSPEHSRSFKFTACAVSENLSGTLSPRSSAIVPGRRAGSPVLRGLKVGEIMSVLRDRSPPREGESMAWPHRRGDESLILASAAYPRRSRSASPPPRVRPGPGPDDEARLAAMFAAVSAEEEAEVDILKLGGVNPDGRTRPLSPRVPGSDWQEGLSTRMAERGGSRLFPTHLAKSAPASASRAPAGMKPGGVFVPGGSPKAKAKAPQAPSLAAEAPSRLKKFCKDQPLSLDEVLELKSLLESKGTLDYTRAKCKDPLSRDSKGKATGPFSASAANAKGDHTGSSMFGSWLRDNCIIAYGIWLTDPDGAGGDDAVACLNSIATFLLTYQSHKMELVINGQKDVKGDEKTWMDRPHIRFIGETGKEDTKWYNHKQNDALGYFLWARCQLALAGKMPFTGEHLKLCGQLFDFLRTIECWDDLDAGHWEESWRDEPGGACGGRCFDPTQAGERAVWETGWLFPGKSDTLSVLETKLEAALKTILPNEVVKPPKNKKDADGALIFLCYPLEVVPTAMGEQILERLETITGHIAVCRYRKDSYWCKDYKELYADPTKHFTDEELKERDANIKPGEEAQWCLFDPMISAYYGGDFSHMSSQVNLNAPLP